MLEIATFRSTNMVSTVIYYIVRPSIYFYPSKFFLVVLAQKFQCLICLSNSNSFQVFRYSLMVDGCIHDGLISNTQPASRTLICWILGEMITLAEFGGLVKIIKTFL